MYRNDTVVPFFALLFGVALGLMAYLDGRHIAQLSGRAPKDLSVGQIGLVAFGLVLVVYGLIGLLSVWLEGKELRPGKHQPRPGVLVLALGLALAVGLVALSGLFVRSIISGFNSGSSDAAEQGALFAGMMLTGAAMIALYKRSFIGEETLSEIEHGEFPW